MEEKPKFCEFCGNKIEQGEEFCTKCGKKVGETSNMNIQNTLSNQKNNQKMPAWAIVLVVLSSLFFIFIIFPSNETLERKESEVSEEITENNRETTKSSETKETEKSSNNPSSSNNNDWYNYDIDEEDKINYKRVSIDTLEKALEENAAAAKEKYNNKYLEITGRLGVIDSDLKYIEIVSIKNEWDLIGVFCNIKNTEQEEAIKKLKKDQKVVVKGKITDVGEIMGYYLDLDEIIGT